ncbi:MAG: restriction endonuclease [Anaerolineae bacterium]|nr:restriction endonuclease [Anaerolineae bacterium]
MSRRQRRQRSELFELIAKLFLVLFLIAYAPLIAWWSSLTPTLRTITIAAITTLVLSTIGLIITLLIYKKRQRASAWQNAMRGWQNKDQASVIAKQQSAKYLSEKELEKFSAHLFSKMGYKAQLTSSTGDHGIDVLLINPKGQKEVVQCKQWNKQVGEPQVRDLFGTMQHEKAVRGWLVAPRGFSAHAKRWVNGKSIELIDDEELTKLLQIISK